MTGYSAKTGNSTGRLFFTVMASSKRPVFSFFYPAAAIFLLAFIFITVQQMHNRGGWLLMLYFLLITESTSTPICAGKNHYLAYGFRRLPETGAVDIVMPDLQKTGGLGEGQRIAHLPDLYYVPFAPHMTASLPGAMAAAHVWASVPGFLIPGWQSYFHTQPVFKEIVHYDDERVKNNVSTLSEKPGIGVEINEEGMKKYAIPGIPFFV